MASNGLKAGTKDIDAVLENRTKLDTLVRALENVGYRRLPINSVTRNTETFLRRSMKMKAGFDGIFLPELLQTN